MKITFEGMGKASLARMISPSLQEELKRFLSERLHGINEIILKLNGMPSSRHLHWVVEDVKMRTKWFLKMTLGTGSHTETLRGHQQAMCRFAITQGHPGKGIYEFHGVLCSGSEWAIVEMLNFIEGRTTLHNVMEREVAREKELSGEELVQQKNFMYGLGVNIAEQVYLVNMTPVTPEQVGEEIYKKYVSASGRRQLYEDALSDTIKRIDISVPPNRNHRLISKQDMVRVRRLVKKLRRNWEGKANRLCLVHGDLNLGNIMVPEDITSPHVMFIDFSPRKGIGEPGWEYGRFLGDLLEAWFKTKSELFVKLIDGFVDRSKALTGDKLFRRSLAWGILAMLFKKVDLNGRPIQNKEVVRWYVQNSLRLLE